MATYKYLDTTGLGQLWAKIKQYVNTIISNFQSDWNASEGEEGHILNRPMWLDIYSNKIFNPSEPVTFEVPYTEGIEITPIRNYRFNHLYHGGQAYIVIDGETITTVCRKVGNGYYLSLSEVADGLFMALLPDKVMIQESFGVGTYTISEIRVSYGEVRIDEKYVPYLQSDWAENDSTSSGYIENRTHWVDDPVTTEVWSDTLILDGSTYYETLTFDDYAWTNNITENSTLSVDFNGVTYICSVRSTGYETYRFGNESLADNTQDDTNEPFLIEITPNYAGYILMLSSINTPTGNTNISISTYNSNIHKLDNKYLNGKLIASGTGENSEIFNGINEYKIASGDYSHAEGLAESQGRELQINLTGEAGATSYSCQVYNYKNGYDILINNGYYNFVDSNYSPINKKITYITVSSSLSDPRSGTIYFDETLSQEAALSNEAFHLFLPQTVASGIGSHAEGGNTMATSYYSHAEGYNTMATSSYSHAEGNNTIASHNCSHAEGGNTTASGGRSHAEGDSTTASSDSSHAEGRSTTASNIAAHSEGNGTTASALAAHSEGNGTTASGAASHSENKSTVASGKYTHAQGENTTANGYAETTIGRYNTLSNANAQTTYNTTNSPYILVAGNGTADNARSNAYTLDWSGNGWYAGKLTVGTAPTADMDVVTKKYVDDSGFMTGMTILAYGASTWADFIDAYTDKKIVYCRASSASDPASGSQTRLAFMAYVNDADNPTEVEFQYYRSVSSHSNNQQGDQVYVYKLNKNSGWSVTVRECYTKVVAGTGLTGNWASGAITLSLSSSIPVGSTATPQPLGTASAGSSSDFSKADHVHALPTLSISSNVITLTGASGQTTSITLPVYNGGVSSS